MSKVLTEDAKAYYAGIRNRYFEKNFPLIKMRNQVDFTKAVISECMQNLYESALVIDNVEYYSESLRESMNAEVMDVLSSAKSMKDIYRIAEDASPYVKDMVDLSKKMYDSKSDEEVLDFNETKLLSRDDLDMINDFEKYEGKDVYASDLQDRVIDVYKAEEELGKEQKDKIEAVVNELARIKANKAEREENSDKPSVVTESIEHGLTVFNTTPKTLFSAIFMNRSKVSLLEGASMDLHESADTILAETIATYTLLETINALGLRNYSEKDVRDLRMQFFTGR